MQFSAIIVAAFAAFVSAAPMAQTGDIGSAIGAVGSALDGTETANGTPVLNGIPVLNGAKIPVLDSDNVPILSPVNDAVNNDLNGNPIANGDDLNGNLNGVSPPVLSGNTVSVPLGNSI